MRNGLIVKPQKTKLSEYTDSTELQSLNNYHLILNELLKEKDLANQKERQKSAFFADMVHEIRTPINIIKSFAQFLQSPDLSQKDTLEYAQIINQCSDNLSHLINDLLDFSKIEAGQIQIVEEKRNLKDLFNELFEQFNISCSQYKSDDVQLKSNLELSPEQSIVTTDFTRLRQILVNLISNALKFTSKGHVSFGCRLSGSSKLLFYVEDTGIGINPEMKNLIFERYKQVNDAFSNTKCCGTGLGLPITKSLVELLQGTIWVESVPNVGSSFYFTIPFK
jgi:signal transduction histidine kinase